MDLTRECAREILEAALGAASGLDIPMAIAVCDAGGHVITLDRMDDCMIVAAEAVQAKARTAVYFRRATAETVERSRQHPTVYGSFVDVSASPIILSMGGLPLWTPAGQLVGAVAAAGGSGQQDVEVATAGEQRWVELQSSIEANDAP